MKRISQPIALAICLLVGAGCSKAPEGVSTDTQRGCSTFSFGGSAPSQLCYREHDGYAVWQKDILLGRWDEMPKGPSGVRGAVSIAQRPSDKWPLAASGNYEVPYKFLDQNAYSTSGQLLAVAAPAATRTLVSQAASHYATKFNTTGEPKIRLVAQTTEPFYVLVTGGDGCLSYVGRQASSPTSTGFQVLQLSPGCGVGGAIHEFGHALGQAHEQTRSDRDVFVIVNWQNIESGFEDQFSAPITVPFQDFGSYDVHSVMHYGRFFFAKENASGVPVGPTLQSRANPNEELGGDVLTASDVSSIKARYQASYYRPPGLVTKSSATASQIVLSFWDPELTETAFAVEYRNRTTGAVSTVNLNSRPGFGTQLGTITGLAADTEYEIRMRTVIGSSHSAWTNYVYVRTAVATGTASGTTTTTTTTGSGTGTGIGTGSGVGTGSGTGGGSGSGSGSGTGGGTGSGTGGGTSPNSAGGTGSVVIRLAGGPEMQAALPGLPIKPVRFDVTGPTGTTLTLAESTAGITFSFDATTRTLTASAPNAAGTYYAKIKARQGTTALPSEMVVGVKVSPGSAFSALCASPAVEALVERNIANPGISCEDGVLLAVGLESVTLAESDLTSLQSLDNFLNIQSLDLTGNRALSDLTPLRGLPNLRLLLLERTNVLDFTPLAALRALTRVAYAVTSGTPIFPTSGLSPHLGRIFPRGGSQ